MAEAWDWLAGPQAEALGVSVAAVLTLVVYSYLLGDNALYRLAEHIFVGASVGYGAVVAYHSVLKPRLFAPLLSAPQDNYILLIPLALSLMLVAGLVPRLRSLSAVPLGLIIGVGAGLAVGGAVGGIIVPQAQATVLSLNPQLPPGQLFDNAIIILATISTLVYFGFTTASRSVPGRMVGGVRSLGKWFMLIAFGALFGNVAMSRISLLISRVQFLLGDWLRVIQ